MVRKSRQSIACETKFSSNLLDKKKPAHLDADYKHITTSNKSEVTSKKNIEWKFPIMLERLQITHLRTDGAMCTYPLLKVRLDVGTHDHSTDCLSSLFEYREQLVSCRYTD